jgi:cytochrome c-type biogenesis protein
MMRAGLPYVLAMAAGVLSFLSPCCLPLMPGYVAILGGAGAQAVSVSRRMVMLPALAFVSGFTLVFTILGASASVLGGLILEYRLGLTRVGGVILIGLGLVTIGVVRVAWLKGERRPFLHRVSGSPATAFPLGMAFAIGWSPCIGPVLTGILAAAASTSSMGTGVALLVAYSLGLGIPFLALAAGAGTPRAMGALRQHAAGIERLGGALLIAIGVLMLTGVWLSLFAPLQRALTGSGWPPI